MAKQIESGVPAGVSEENSEEKMEYKNKVVFLRKSRKGAHLYAFNYEGALGGDVGSLIMDVSEVERLLAGSTEWIKVGVVPAKEGDEKSSSDLLLVMVRRAEEEKKKARGMYGEPQ